MTEQLALVGVPTPPDLRLTRRQRQALEHIHANQPVTSQDLGEHLATLRGSQPGVWAASDGARMGRRLRDLGLARYSRKRGGWITADAPAAPRADFGAFPEGF